MNIEYGARVRVDGRTGWSLSRRADSDGEYKIYFPDRCSNEYVGASNAVITHPAPTFREGQTFGTVNGDRVTVDNDDGVDSDGDVSTTVGYTKVWDLVLEETGSLGDLRRKYEELGAAIKRLEAAPQHDKHALVKDQPFWRFDREPNRDLSVHTPASRGFDDDSIDRQVVREFRGFADEATATRFAEYFAAELRLMNTVRDQYGLDYMLTRHDWRAIADAYDGTMDEGSDSADASAAPYWLTFETEEAADEFVGDNEEDLRLYFSMGEVR